jgi:hypothetical protein
MKRPAWQAGRMMPVRLIRNININMQYNLSAPEGDINGFAKRFLVCSDAQLIDAYNREVDKVNRTNDRFDYLLHLHREMVNRDFDCSAVMNGRSMSMDRRVRLVDNKLVV